MSAGLKRAEPIPTRFWPCPQKMRGSSFASTRGRSKAGVVRLNYRPVLYAEVPVNFVDAHESRLTSASTVWIGGGAQVNHRQRCFEGSDGRFVASEGGVPAGDYFLTAQEAIAPDGELSPDELDYLVDSDYRIWRISLAPEMDIRGCNLYATGSKQAPQIEFAGSRQSRARAPCFRRAPTRFAPPPLG